MARTADPQRRTFILQAARKIFLQQGYVEARMVDIAEEAGVAAGTLYRYFESKEILAQALTEEFFQHLAKEISPILLAVQSSEALPEIMTKVLSVARKYRDILTIAPTSLGEGRGTIARCPRLQFVKQMAAILEKLMEQDVIRDYDPLSLADMITALIQRVVMESLVWEKGGQKDYEATVLQMLELALF
ncbi:MAG: TetR/AcrR family transcriptional regulator [Waterburya sp.]